MDENKTVQNDDVEHTIDLNTPSDDKPKLQRRLSYYPNDSQPLGIMQMIKDEVVQQEEVEVIEGVGQYLEIDAKTKIYYEIDGEECDQKIILLNPYITTLRVFDELTKFLVGFRVLRFDYRCLGKTESAYEKITSTRCAEDAMKLLQKLNWDKVHVFGYGVGGMIAQELALMLHDQKKILSLYLASTSSGSFLRFAGGPDFYEDAMLNFVLTKPETEQRSLYMNDNFSEKIKGKVSDVIEKNWKIYFDHRMKARTTQCCIYYGHYASLKRLSQLIGQISIAVQISSEDKFHKISDQNWLIENLKATKVEFMGCVSHLDALFYKAEEMANEIIKNAKNGTNK